MKRIILTDTEKAFVSMLNHQLYTIEYLEDWINRNDNVFVNAPVALNAIAAKGFYEAVKTYCNMNCISDNVDAFES